MRNTSLTNGYAGCGKTTSILQKAAESSASSNNLFLAFNRSIIKEFSAKLPKNWEITTVTAKALKTLPEILDLTVTDKKFKMGLNFDEAKAVQDTIKILGYLDCRKCLYTLENQEEFYENYGKLDTKKVDLSEILSVINVNGIKSTEHYDTIVVDEFQDLSMDMILFIDSLSCDNLLFTGDTYQNIYQFRGTLSEPATFIANYFNVKEIKYLKKSYRLNKSVVNLINSFKIIEPKLEALNTNTGSVKLSKDLSVDTTVLGRTNKELSIFKRNNPNYKGAIMTIHKAKGLEFNNVAILNYDKLCAFKTLDEFNVLYTAISRTKNDLYLL